MRLLNSTLFRLTLVYAAFFCFAVSLLLGFVYFSIVREMEDQIRHRINAQTAQALAAYKEGGLEELRRQLYDYVEQEDEGIAITLLEDDKGNVIFGNMESWPQEIAYEGQWLTFSVEKSRGDDYARMLARETQLADGGRLLVGFSLFGPTRTKQIVIDVVPFTLALAFIFMLLGGTLFSRMIERRLQRVNQICAQVVGGRLDVSVPITGSNDAFDHLAGNVNAMLARIAELVKGLQQTSDNIAHDLRTPLGRHRNRLEGLAASPPSGAKLQAELKASMDEIDGLVETLNSILRISQAQSGVSPEHLVTFDLAEAAENIADFYMPLAEEKQITLEGALPGPLPVTADKPMLTQSIANLLDNAIKYTPEGGHVRIALSREGKDIICEVADTGPGIPEAYHQKVKERFFRLEQSRTSKGTGLGLSLADAVARLHKGRLVFADNKPGLLVRLSLPIAAGADALPPRA